MDDDEQVTAWHEAGHAIMALLCGGQIERVTLEPPYDDGPARFGDTVTHWRGLSQQQMLEAEIQVSLAGPVSEMIYRDETFPLDSYPEWMSDWATAYNAAMILTKNNNLLANSVLDGVAKKIKELFEPANTWAAISAIAEDLLAHETLDHEQIAYSVDFWRRR